MRGVSLIELMVALLIGTILVLGLVEVFAASRTAYQLSTGLARVQENGRFALDFLRRDLRMAGHLGCVNDQARFLPENVTSSRPPLISTFLTPAQQAANNFSAEPNAALRFDTGVGGYDAKVGGSGVATGSGSTVTLAATPVLASAASNWSPILPNTLWNDLQGGDGATTTRADPILNSDVVVLRFFSPVGAQVTSFVPGTPAQIRFAPSQGTRLTENVASSPGLFGLTDCMNAAVFQASSVNTTTGQIEVAVNGLNESGFLGQHSFTVGQSMVYRAESIVYYIGLNDQNNPALYRLRYSSVPGATGTTYTREEMVEGIESLQLQYGVDSRPAAADGRPTGNIGESMLGSAVSTMADPTTAWRRVGLVQVGLVARSPESAAAAQRDAALPGMATLGVRVTPPDDRRYRYVYEDSVAVRNRLFGN